MQLRPFQSEALKRLRQSGHLLCIAPTGSGKSLIYETIAGESGRRTLLITPLVALARQQAARLKARDISTVLYPGMRPKPAPPSGAGVWIMSPESLESRVVRARLKTWQPDFLVVDECHCLYDWGERFRHAFVEVPSLARDLSIPRSLWLTATLPPPAYTHLKKAIGEPLHRIGRFSLPSNLHLSFRHAPWIHRTDLLYEETLREEGPGIVFVTTREATHRVSRLLTGFGRRAIAYHAGLSQEERLQIESDLRKDSTSVLVATSAFGMGMDYLHLRWTVLWQPPVSLLAFAQSIGRIGRNREQASRATVFWDEEDFRMLQWMTRGSERQTQALNEVQAYLSSSACRVRGLENYFNDFREKSTRGSHPCGQCDFCEPLPFIKSI